MHTISAYIKALLFIISLATSLPLAAKIKTCAEVNAIDINKLSFNQASWWENKTTEVKKYQLQRRQAEIAKTLEAVYIHPQGTGVITEDKIKAMSDIELDFAGEGIFFAPYTDSEGTTYDFVQTGFGGGNWLGIFFTQGTTDLATALFLNETKCATLPASPFTPQ